MSKGSRPRPSYKALYEEAVEKMKELEAEVKYLRSQVEPPEELADDAQQALEAYLAEDRVTEQELPESDEENQ